MNLKQANSSRSSEFEYKYGQIRRLLTHFCLLDFDSSSKNRSNQITIQIEGGKAPPNQQWDALLPNNKQLIYLLKCFSSIFYPFWGGFLRSLMAIARISEELRGRQFEIEILCSHYESNWKEYLINLQRAPSPLLPCPMTTIEMLAKFDIYTI